VTTTVETTKAISTMGAMKKNGTLVHSYLEDGYPDFLEIAQL
jgi:hypothetical protein